MSVLLFACNDNPEFVDEMSINLDGTDYNYSSFTVDTTWLEDQNRLFIKKEDGDNTFTFNFPLEEPMA